MQTDYVIPPGEAHVWVTDPTELDAPLGLRLAREVLNTSERARMRRLHFADDRQQYLVSHAMLRFALSACAPTVPPGEWTFTANAHGRPELLPPHTALRFNLSHTDGLVACVVARDIDCGIDVELARRRDVELLGAHVLARAELDALSELPGDQRSALFFRYWTLKEAYVKARGMGMALPLDACVFDPEADGVAMVSHPVDDHPEPDGWQFLASNPTDRHVLAVAVRAGRAGFVRIVHHPGEPEWTTPGAEFWRLQVPARPAEVLF